MSKFRLVNDTGFPGDWKLLDEFDNNIFERLLVTSLILDATSLPKVILEVPIYPDTINMDVVVKAEDLGLKIVEHRIVRHDLEKDTVEDAN